MLVLHHIDAACRPKLTLFRAYQSTALGKYCAHHGIIIVLLLRSLMVATLSRLCVQTMYRSWV